jgi:anthranilate synthase component 1
MWHTLKPTLDQVRAAPEGATVPVYRAFPSDTETPISAFLKLRRGSTAFLLESAEYDGRMGRYSFIGVKPDALLRADLDRGTIETEAGSTAYEGSVFDALRRLAGTAPVVPSHELPGFIGGAVGFLGYDVVRGLERLPAAREPAPGAAAIFGRYSTMVVFDHLMHRMLVVSAIEPGADREEGYRRAGARVEEVIATLRRAPTPPPLELASPPVPPEVVAASATSVPSEKEFMAAVARAREYVLAGDAIQIVLSRRLGIPFSGDPFRLYRALRMLSPSPYMFYLEFPELALVGASPEMLLRVDGDVAQVAPIAGTRARGATPESDQALAQQLKADPKERAEHVMLVDLGRNDLSRVCRAGSVHVQSLMEIERFSHVMHLVSTITGRLDEKVDALDALAACFPAGTVTGAPKIRAMEIIAESEPLARGPYAGAVGYVGFGGTSLDTCIAIRMVAVRSGTAAVQVGAGIVADSEPERELEETSEKARAMLSALAMVEPDGRRSADVPRRQIEEAVR